MRKRCFLNGRNLFVTVLLLFAAHSIWSPQAKGDNGEESVRSVLLPFFNDPRFANVATEEIKWGNKGIPTKLPREIMEHPEGIFWLQDSSSFSAYLGNYPSLNLNGRTQFRVLNPRNKNWGEQACLQQAHEFLSQHLGSFFKSISVTSVVITKPSWVPNGYTGAWRFSWRRLDEEASIIDEVSVNVRDADGRIVGFNAFRLGIAPHTVSATQAEKAAMQAVYQNSRFVKVKCFAKIVDEVSKAPRSVWRVIVTGIEAATNKSASALVLVDAATGEVLEKTVAWKIHENNLLKKEQTASMPTWSSVGLFLNSVHAVTGAPEWAPVLPQTLLYSVSNRMAHITQDLEVAPNAVYGLITSSWISIERSGWTYALDGKTGQYRVLGTPTRSALTPTVSPDGKWAVVSATSNAGTGDLDLFADNLERAPALGLRTRLAIPQSNEHHPLFSPDGKWLYFVSTRLEKDKATQKEKIIHALLCLPATVAQTKTLTRLKPEQMETLIAALPGDVQRLSVFSNGQRLLLQTDQGIFTVSVANRKIMRVEPKNLVDTELKLPITNLQDSWAGPNNGEVTFSGQTNDAKKQVRRRIYSCRFDGSGLKLRTPTDNLPVPAYQFPNSEKTSFDLAKEMALQEIRWDNANS